MLRSFQFISFYLTVLLLTSLSGISSAQVVDRIIARVDNQILLESEYQMGYLQFTSSQEIAPGTDMDLIRCTVLETLLINKMLLAKAEIDSVTVDDQAIDNEVDRRMQYFLQQLGSEEKLTQMYGKTVPELKTEMRAQVKEQLVVQRMQQTITGSVSVTPAEVRKFYNEIPKDSLPFFSTEVEVGQIVIVPEISRSSKIKAKEKLLELRQRVLAGEDFCTLARIYSEDPGSANQCGEIGYFEKGQLVEQYELTALRLDSGEVSEVIESQFGFHLIQLIDRKGMKFNTRHILIRPQSSDQDYIDAEVKLDSIRHKILKDSLDFARGAKVFSKDKGSASTGGLLVDPGSGSTHISLEQIDPKIYFILDTMKVGQMSAPIRYTTDDGIEAYRIIWYKARYPAHGANLKDDYQKIQTAALEEKKAKTLNKWFDTAKKEVYVDINNDYKTCELQILH
jgi:peptidyl-prolyl cis-trans isomerase SurA